MTSSNASFFSLFNHRNESIEMGQTSSDANIPNELMNKFGVIKFILWRLNCCFVVSEQDELFFFNSKAGQWNRWKTNFKQVNERIVHISASYHAFVLILQSGHHANNISTRIVWCFFNDYGNDVMFGENLSKYSEEVEVLSTSSGVNNDQMQDEFDFSTITWYQVQDDFQLREGEYINYTSCAAFTCIFITSHGRLFACGSNQFAEIAQPTVGFRTGCTICKVKLCCLDPDNECKDPFFIKSVNGDHNIIAITKDHNIFYCGYQMDGDNDLAMMKQLKRFPTMEPEEYFIDIAATYYGVLYLTNKFNLYQNGKSLGDLSDKIGETVTSCQIWGSPSTFLLLVNNIKIFDMPEDSLCPQLIHTVTNQRPNKTLHLSADSSFTAYWRSSFEHKNLKEQIENLNKRVSDSLLSDIDFIIA